MANKLISKDLRVWYDKFTLTLGDSLRRSIDIGLARSRYGVVVLSDNFFEKEWPQKELDGLISREREGDKVILPIWHNVTEKQVRSYSPILASKVAISSEKGVDVVVDEILRAIKKPRISPFKEDVDTKRLSAIVTGAFEDVNTKEAALTTLIRVNAIDELKKIVRNAWLPRAFKVKALEAIAKDGSAEKFLNDVVTSAWSEGDFREIALDGLINVHSTKYLIDIMTNTWLDSRLRKKAAEALKS